MPTTMDSYWPAIRQAIKARIATDSTAEVHSVISALRQAGTIIWKDGMNISDEEKQNIVAPLLESGEYITLPVEYQLYVFRNPSFKLHESIRLTNDSIRGLNSFLKRTNAMSVVIAVVTAVFIILTYVKDKSNEAPGLYGQILRQLQTIDSLRQVTMQKDQEIQRLEKFSPGGVHRQGK